LGDTLLGALVDVLSGRGDDEFLSMLALTRQNARELHFDRFWPALAGDLGTAAVSRLRARLAALPDRHRRRVEEAPEAWTLVVAPLATGASLVERAARLEQWCEVEEALAGGADRIARPGGGWSALGDAYLPGPAAARQHAPSALGDAYLPGSAGARRACESATAAGPLRGYRAPVIGIGVPVDWQSPGAGGPLVEVAGAAAPFDAPSIALALQRLDRVDELLDRPGLEQWRELVRCHTAVIVLRNDPTVAGFISGTTRLALRRPVFRNPHASDADPARMLDGWVHESVHAVLDTLELVAPFVAEDVFDGRHRLTMPSPWTGRALDLDTYVHATLVWFALWNLWVDVLRADVLPDAEAVAMLTRAGRGFLSPGALPSLLSGRSAAALTDGVAEALSEAHARVTAAMTGSI
jgi:hypothetical protein